MPQAPPILIVGGGIAGLACALALVRQGFEVRVCERAAALTEVGAGISLWQNALAVLREAGLEGAVVAAGGVLEAGEIRDARGRVLMTTPLAAVARELGLPAVALHRARLIELLRQALPAGVLQLGRSFEGFEPQAGGVRARFADGGEEQAGLLIGADGLRSRVRAQLFGERPLRYAGYTCWRGLSELPFERFPARTAWEVWGPGARFGIVRMGGPRVYWFFTLNAPEGGQEPDALAEIGARVRGWCAPIAEVVQRCEPDSLRRDDIHDRPPLATWSRGCVTLLGDAAHPMTPNLGQGACQGIVDGAVLARCLRAESDLARALGRYERERLARTRAITSQSWRLGWLGQRERAWERAVRDRLLAWTPAAWTRRAFEASVR